MSASIAARLLNQHLAVGVLLNAQQRDAVFPQAGPAQQVGAQLLGPLSLQVHPASEPSTRIKFTAVGVSPA